MAWTPCPRCSQALAELAELQDFYDIHRLRPDLQQLTFNIAGDQDSVRRFMASHGYRFPVVVDHALERSLFPIEGDVPKEWIIDRNGLRSDSFRGWTLGRVMREAEKLIR